MFFVDQPWRISHAPRHPARYAPGDRSPTPRQPDTLADRHRVAPFICHRPLPLASLQPEGRAGTRYRLWAVRAFDNTAFTDRRPAGLSAQAEAPHLGSRADSCRIARTSRPFPGPIDSHASACLPEGGHQSTQAIPTSSDCPGQARRTPRHLGDRRSRKEAAQDWG
jgi:hypothetical protein